MGYVALSLPPLRLLLDPTSLEKNHYHPSTKTFSYPVTEIVGGRHNSTRANLIQNRVRACGLGALYSFTLPFEKNITEIPLSPFIYPKAFTVLKHDSIQSNIQSKGTPRRKTKRVHKSSGADDKKLQTTLKKMNVQPIQAIEEVNMFKEDGNVIHFSAPRVHASVPSNTFALYGNGEEKELTELVPGILNQLGPDSLASLRKLAESYQNLQKKEGAEKKEDDDEDDIPDLVEGENFESKVE
ncbi:hypothetical protein DTO271G3_5285 [Paecilomyces variotii]|nr:hypothetical protein DTO271G3_5285 [Paecilomyces variotii]